MPHQEAVAEIASGRRGILRAPAVEAGQDHLAAPVHDVDQCDAVAGRVGQRPQDVDIRRKLDPPGLVPAGLVEIDDRPVPGMRWVQREMGRADDLLVARAVDRRASHDIDPQDLGAGASRRDEGDEQEQELARHAGSIRLKTHEAVCSLARNRQLLCDTFHGMYDFALDLHSWLRWAALIGGLVATLAAFTGGASGKADRWGLVFMITMDLQLLFGLALYLVLSPTTAAIFGDFGAAMRDPVARFWAVEHVSIDAAGRGDGARRPGARRERRATPAARRKRLLICFALVDRR